MLHLGKAIAVSGTGTAIGFRDIFGERLRVL